MREGKSGHMDGEEARWLGTTTSTLTLMNGINKMGK